MTNIWSFFNQTLTVTLIACMVLLVKFILKNNLPSRWQYNVWIVLLLRMLMPVDVNKALFIPTAVFLEHLKGIAEKGLDSVFSGVYETMAIKHVIPYLTGMPVSITDWIFAIYVLGTAGMMLWYLISYVRLRRLVKKGISASKEMQDKIHYISKKYNLRYCQAIEMQGISSAFICGVIHPILVLPEDRDVDEKIILHELLHLQSYDAFQSVVWCILRCLHWCNPFLQYVFNQIGNDMEALCDQKVLEHLEGEERREYGIILLSMANEQYARVPGTSSISNGGKNISKRIESIVKFKKYPKGMELVAVCITLVLAIPAIQGTDYVFAASDYNPRNESDWNHAAAIARVNRAKTVAGAINTYANGILEENEVYMLLTSPLDKHDEIIAHSNIGDNTFFDKYGLDVGNSYYESSWGITYSVWNIMEKENDVYEAYIVYGISSYDSPNYSIIVPIEIRNEDGWVVEETGERLICPRAISTGFIIQGTDTGLPEAKQYAMCCDSGEVRISTWLHYEINNMVETDEGFLNEIFNRQIDRGVKLDAEFTTINMWSLAEYSYENAKDGNKPADFFGILYKDLDALDEKIEFEKLYVGAGNGGGQGDESFAGQQVSYGTTIDMEGRRTILREEREDEIMEFPAGYAVRIFWDGKQVEEVIVPEAEEYVVNERLYPLYGTAQYSTHISSANMIQFQSEKKEIETPAENRLANETIREKLEAWAFAEEEDKTYLIQELNESGVYHFENTVMTNILCVHPVGTTIFEPQFFYDVYEDSWIVLGFGYCTEIQEDSIVKKEVGEREVYGVSLLGEKSIYDCGSLITSQYSTLSNEEGTVRKVNENSSGDTEGGGVWYELQDYTSKETGYVGYRWFGATTFGPGFEQMDADVVVFYNHTK